MNQTSELINQKSPNQRFWIVIGLVTMISLVECYSQYSVKKGNGEHNYNSLFIGIFGYAIVCYLLWESYNFEAMGHVNLLWSCMSIILAFLVGVFIFKEKFNKYTLTAIALAVSAIYVSHLSDEN
jgi:multidrug transporter EmrE-like cation transporter